MRSCPIKQDLSGVCVELFRIRAKRLRRHIRGHAVEAVNEPMKVGDTEGVLLQIAAGITAISIVPGDGVHWIVGRRSESGYRACR
jgi:hypothetical protein